MRAVGDVQDERTKEGSGGFVWPLQRLELEIRRRLDIYTMVTTHTQIQMQTRTASIDVIDV